MVFKAHLFLYSFARLLALVASLPVSLLLSPFALSYMGSGVPSSRTVPIGLRWTPAVAGRPTGVSPLLRGLSEDPTVLLQCGHNPGPLYSCRRGSARTLSLSRLIQPGGVPGCSYGLRYLSLGCLLDASSVARRLLQRPSGGHPGWRVPAAVAGEPLCEVVITSPPYSVAVRVSQLLLGETNGVTLLLQRPL